ncbi:MAG: DUF1036 domain-containing protein [Rhizobiaceae bacterium]|nr:MAG: DUF1036 domain-containing protein [Rhizobiaceae bacterium]
MRAGRRRRRSAGSGVIVAATALCALVFPATRAMAGFTVCNQTLDVVNVALGEEVDGQFQTDGWWTIGANRCVDVIRSELASRYVYIYATDVFGNAILKGATEMCVDRRRFTIRGIGNCWERGYIAARFHEVDTLDQVRWTMFLRRSGP